MKSITILIVEDETLIRQGLRALLEKEDFVEAVYEAADSTDFKQQISRREFDIILMDMKLPGRKGPDLIADMSVNNGQQKVIVVTGLEGVEIVVNLLKLGVRAIVSKLEGYTEIIKAIKEVMNSGHYFQERIYSIIQTNHERWDSMPPVSLSFKENELIRAIASGLTTKEMATRLKMSESTTETYRTRLIKKLSVTNTAGLVAYVYRNGIL